MKSALLLLALLLFVPSLTAAQTQTRERRSGDREILPTSDSSGVRNRVVGQSRSANHVEKQQGTPAEESATLQTTGANNPLNQKAAEPRWGNTSVIIRPVENKSTAPPVALATNEKTAVERTNKPITKLVQRTAIIAEVKPAKSPILSNPNARSAAPLRVPLATAVYLVGKGDVLDIRLANIPTRESTLYTVLKNGLVEYPLLNGPINVVGLSTDEIAKLLSTQIKVIQAARVSVSVRDYASHEVVVTGLVDSPGRKILRREAMPLYTVLAEALPRPEATLATLVRGGKTETVPLDNEQAMSTLVVPGDIIKVSADSVNAKGFVYVGGNVTSPGEKEFRDGMTLTQVLISAGGTRSTGKTTIKVARRNANGFLTTNEYNLHSIADGKAQDPLLQAGDRIEVTGGE